MWILLPKRLFDIYLQDLKKSSNITSNNDIAGAQLGGGGWEENGGLPCCFFSKIKKSAPILVRNGRDCVHFWVQFSIQILVLRVSRRKISQIFPCFFSCVLTKRLSRCPNCTKPSLLWKILGCTLAWKDMFQIID